MTALLRVDGVVIYWTPTEWTSRDALLAGWTPSGYAKFVPAPREHIACLKSALGGIYPGHLIRPLEKRDGFVIYQERVGREENTFHRLLTVKVFDDGVLYFPMDTPTTEERENIERKYQQQQGLLTGSQVTTALVAILDRLGGTRLRPSGGLYWLAEKQLSAWEDVRGIAEVSGVGKQTKVYLIRHALDTDALRAVRDAILEEVQAETARITKEIETTELGDRALKNRQDEAEALLAKVEEYEKILGEQMPTLRQLCEETTNAACSAALLDSAGAVSAHVA